MEHLIGVLCIVPWEIYKCNITTEQFKWIYDTVMQEFYISLKTAPTHWQHVRMAFLGQLWLNVYLNTTTKQDFKNAAFLWSLLVACFTICKNMCLFCPLPFSCSKFFFRRNLKICSDFIQHKNQTYMQCETRIWIVV